jgi:signal transduction histidine kinase
MRYDAALGGWDEAARLLFGRDARPGEPVARERAVGRADGSTVSVESTLSPLLTAAGEPAGVVEIMKDLTPMRRLEEAVRDARTLAALGEMAAGLAHEIRNPLGGIKGFATLLARDVADDAPRARLVARIVDGVDALNRILTDFLAYGAPGSPQARAFDARDLASEVLALVAAEALGRGRVAIEPRFAPDEAPAHADRDHAAQALLNILRNAIEASPDGGRVAVAVGADAEAVTIAVTDEGPGLPPEIQARLFRPFGSTKRGGTGLGLAVAKSLVDRSGGSLGIATGPGGTTATILLPRATADARR